LRSKCHMKYFISLFVICIGIAILVVHWPFDNTQLPQVEQIIATSSIPEIATTTIATTTEIIEPVIKPFTILLVPGHDALFGGAAYKNINERDLAVEISDNIASILYGETDYRVIVARSTTTWNPILQDYFDSNKQAIIDFKNAKQAEEKALLKSGEKKYVADIADHSDATPRSSVQLYGMNKWSNENDVDLIIHIHFNDSWRKNMALPGGFKGFSIYVPERQMINSSTSIAIAENIFDELKTILTPEIVGNRKNSLIEDQSLIAVGASGTLNKPGMLIEYGYIYEKPLRTAVDRENMLKLMAEKTVLGIKNYVKIKDNE